jgi:hypothetical protein
MSLVAGRKPQAERCWVGLELAEEQLDGVVMAPGFGTTAVIIGKGQRFERWRMRPQDRFLVGRARTCHGEEKGHLVHVEVVDVGLR